METDEIYMFAVLKAAGIYFIITLGFLFIYTMYKYLTEDYLFSQSLSIIFQPIFYSNNLILLFIILTYFLYKAKKEIDLF